MLRFSVAVKVMVAATRLLPEIKCALLIFISGKRFCARGTVAVAVRIRGPYISSASELRLRSSTAADQRSAAGPRPASCRWRRRKSGCSFVCCHHRKLTLLQGRVCNYHRCRRPSQRLRALNRFSKSLRFFEKRALRRAVLPHCGRHSPTLHFVCF